MRDSSGQRFGRNHPARWGKQIGMSPAGSILPRLRCLSLAAAAALWLGACSSRPLPKYEPPLARTPVQSVRTTAYTDTEDDHVAYGAHNALGGLLHAAPAPPPMIALPAQPVNNVGGFQRPVYIPTAPAVPLVYGSAAADWSRWPAGTIFRIISTRQVYRVDDYGWALAGRNTIDLYLPSRRAMNAWGLRREAIEILQWGDPQESLRILRPRGKFRHVQRMILELNGNARAAARLE